MDLADASLVVAALKTGCTNIWTLDRAERLRNLPPARAQAFQAGRNAT
jgi:hypothetical protein